MSTRTRIRHYHYYAMYSTAIRVQHMDGILSTTIEPDKESFLYEAKSSIIRYFVKDLGEIDPTKLTLCSLTLLKTTYK